MDSPSCIENKMLQDMYLGEEERDATSKVLGYIYQDLVAIEYLLDENVEYICMECIEDIFFVRNSNGVREYNIVQVKYYPKSHISKENVLRDLYYQYIRMDKLNYKNTRPHLKYHCPKKVEFTDEDYNKLGELVTGSPNKDTCTDLITYIKNELKNKKKKIELEEGVIKEFSDAKLFKSFQEEMKNGNEYSALNEAGYSECLAEQIFSFIDVKKEDYEPEQQKEILLGLTIRKIHSFYQKYANEKDPTKKYIRQKDFWNSVKNSFNTHIETISAYIINILYGIKVDIMSNLDELNESDKIVDLCRQYKIIFDNTEQWLNEITKSEDGIRSLVKTLSKEKEFSAESLFLQVVREAENIKSFLMRLVKILFDIYNAQKEAGNDDPTLLDPKTHFINHSNYIMFHFKHDCGSSMILSRIDSDMSESILCNVYPRLLDCKPQKWYMPGSCNFRGLKNYSSNVCEIIDHNDIVKSDSDIASIHEGNFVVKCVECIKVDKRDWSICAGFDPISANVS